MISPRFAPAVCALLGLALVPTFIHSYADFTIADGLTTQAIPGVLAGYSSAPGGRNATWGQRRFDSDDWIDRRYAKADDEVKLTVVRSYDAKRLYHHPELAVAYGTNFVRTEVMQHPRRPDIPVYVLSAQSDGGAVALYVLHYDGRFVADPIRFQLRSAGELLFSGRRPMTLFFLTDTSTPTPATLETLPATELLFAAIDHFVADGARSR